MSYSIMMIQKPYGDYLNYFRSKNPQIQKLDYNGYYDALMQDSFIDWGELAEKLCNMGAEARLIIYDDDIQKRWKPELGRKNKFEVLCEQINEIKPDVIYVADIGMFSEEQWIVLNGILSWHGTKKIAWHFSSLNDLRYINKYDLILTGSPCYAKKMSVYHPKVKYLQHAFSGNIIDRADIKTVLNRVAFAGHFFLPIHGKRLLMCADMIENGVDLEIAGDIVGTYRNDSLKHLIKHIIHPQRLSDYEKQLKNGEIRIKNCRKSGVYGLEYFRFVGEHTVNLNCHSDDDFDDEDSGNYRMYEVTGMGSCLLTNAAKGNKQFFEPDYEIMEYRDAEECIEKAKWLLDHPQKAKEIAEAGQKRTLKQYNYDNQANQMCQYIRELLG